MRHDLFERFAVGGEDIFAEREGDTLDHFLERVFRRGVIGRPYAQMELNLAGSGENRGLHARVLRIDRCGALLDFRFRKPGGAHFAIKKARRRRPAVPGAARLFP